jgi:hypothetical protein
MLFKDTSEESLNSTNRYRSRKNHSPFFAVVHLTL